MNRLATYYRLVELADHMRRAGLGCPNCGHLSKDHRFVDDATGPLLSCSSCGLSFTAEDLVVKPDFEMAGELVVLYRPVGPNELAKIEATGWSRFPPRLVEQPICYPVLNQRDAEYIAET